MMNRVTQRGLQYILAVMDRRPAPWHCAWIEARDSIQAFADQPRREFVAAPVVVAILDTAYREHREDYSLLQTVGGVRRGVQALVDDGEGALVGCLVQAVCRLLGVRDGWSGPQFRAWDEGLRERMEERAPEFVASLQALHDTCLILERSWDTGEEEDRRPWAARIRQFVADDWMRLAKTGGTPGQLTGPIFHELSLSNEFSFDGLDHD